MASESPTASMAIDILSHKDSKYLLEDCKELKNVEAIVKYLSQPDRDGERKKVVMYVVLLYSADSVLNRVPQIPLEERKLKAADMVGFERNSKDEFKSTLVDRVFKFEDDNVFEMVFGFIKYQNNSLWMEIVATENMLDDYIKGMMKKIDEKDDKKNLDALNVKTKLRQEVRSINEDLKQMYKDFYRDHDDFKEKARTRVKRNSIESRVLKTA